ncbi:MAG: XdhC family protein [Rhizobiaceae bacterium]
MDSALLTQLNDARKTRQAVCVVRNITNATARLLLAEDIASDELSGELGKRLKSGKSGMIEHGRAEVFIQVYLPPPRLVIIGAVHISQALAPMAKACNFDVSIIDPRTAFATKDRFFDVALHGEWPIEILKDQPLDPFTALVAVTHDPKIDDIPLRMALEAGCFYVGALGSRKTHAKRVERLKAEKLEANVIARINAPIGLDIGAANPAEIAVAVMAEIIAQLRQCDAK